MLRRLLASDGPELSAEKTPSFLQLFPLVPVMGEKDHKVSYCFWTQAVWAKDGKSVPELGLTEPHLRRNAHLPTTVHTGPPISQTKYPTYPSIIANKTTTYPFLGQKHNPQTSSIFSKGSHGNKRLSPGAPTLIKYLENLFGPWTRDLSLLFFWGPFCTLPP
ncbi:hypothetical protein O181_076534 [Austropuccinia psidii MF-1]|uniref:Uncharacterized protein n=1 Tax=Austropuccinia psidii MF-1 TaxID=1389203 RepID=A0A9Q3FCP8_9BASI|nr:hypothetical protein [Austropuccinia psidii MF-1]